MNHFCVSCEHTAVDHLNGVRCEGESVDPDYGRYRCMCPIFEKDTDD